jgi:23S rRNA (cytidine1920-2'-O)/16S rRNA (cytidine1409-2'-O)-methyltransferase
VNGTVAARPSTPVGTGDRLDVAAGEHYVSRGANKLLGALDDLGVQVGGRALDAGASTGGFTQVLLERGCRPVYAVDVGTDQLAPALRSDPRVVVLERTNLRELTLAVLDGEPIQVVVGDLSFIPLVAVADPAADVLLLVKPQFEVGRSRLGKNGVVRDAGLRREAVEGVVAVAAQLGWGLRRCVRSRHPGPSGNVEFFVWLRRGPICEQAYDGVEFG